MKDSKHKKLIYLISSILLLLIVLVFIGTFFLMHKRNRSIQASSNSSVQVEKIHQVSLMNNSSNPNELIIKVGDQVQFNAMDDKLHNIAPGRGNDYGQKHEHVDNGVIESGNFSKGEAYLATFKKAGTYYFHDDNNPNIFITILAY